jgi:GTP cyclohydrolase I
LPTPYDAARVEAAVRELLSAVGEDPDREGLVETPARVARMYAEVFAGLLTDPADLVLPLFDEKHDEMVIVKDIPLASFCEHHLIPWTGHAAVGYLPGKDGRITGLSKLARLVDLYAKRPSVQERVTGQVADALMDKLQPRGAIVVVEAEHLCMSMRGVQKPGARTVTSAVRGSFKSSAVTRTEAMSLILGR